MSPKYERPKKGPVTRPHLTGQVIPSRPGTHVGDSVIATVQYGPSRGVRIKVEPTGAFRGSRAPIGVRFIPNVVKKEITRTVWDGIKWISEAEFKALNPSIGTVPVARIQLVKATKEQTKQVGKCAEGSIHEIRSAARGITGNR